jgi:hypothetical protein
MRMEQFGGELNQSITVTYKRRARKRDPPPTAGWDGILRGGWQPAAA